MSPNMKLFKVDISFFGFREDLQEKEKHILGTTTLLFSLEENLNASWVESILLREFCFFVCHAFLAFDEIPIVTAAMLLFLRPLATVK